MEISIFLTILFIIISLGGAFLQDGKICPIVSLQMDASINIKNDFNNSLSIWAVKFNKRDLNLLNTVTLDSILKAIQTSLNQLQNIKFEG